MDLGFYLALEHSYFLFPFSLLIAGPVPISSDEMQKTLSLSIFRLLLSATFLISAPFFFLRGFDYFHFSVNRAIPSPVIAVFDTGFDFENTSYSINQFLIPKGQNKISLQDHHGHGTQISLRILETCPECRILPIKISENEASFSFELFNEGVILALNEKVQVMNFSFGMIPNSEEVESKIFRKSLEILKENFQKAEERGVFLIGATATGISTPLKSEPLSTLIPQSSPFVTVIGSTLESGHPDPLSHYGPELDISLPPSLYLSSNLPHQDSAGGASLASALVSGLAGKIFQHNAGLSPHLFRHSLRMATESTKQRKEEDFKRLGYGVLPISEIKIAQAHEHIQYRIHKIFKNNRDTPSQGIAFVDFSSVYEVLSVSGGWICPPDEVNERLEDHRFIRFDKISLPKGRTIVPVTQPNVQCDLGMTLKLKNEETSSFMISISDSLYESFSDK
jgi:hypothetical protein